MYKCPMTIINTFKLYFIFLFEMILKLLGIFDILVALMILSIHFNILPFKIYILVFFFVFLKGLFFYKNINGILEILISLYTLFIFFGHKSLIDFIIIAYFLQKGFYSLI